MALLFLLVPYAMAEDKPAQEVTVTPVLQQISLKPGSSTNATVEFVNQGKDPFKLSVEASPYHVVGEQYDPAYTPLKGTQDPSKWITLDTTSVAKVDPGSIFATNYTITAPANTAPGGYYAVVFGVTTPLNDTGGGVTQQSRVGQLVYITVEGPVKKQGTARFETTKSLVIGQNINAASVVKNQGGIHFRTTYTTKITNLFGKTVYDHSEQYFILPQTERRIAATWMTHAWFGIYKLNSSATVPDGDSMKTVKSTTQWIVTATPQFLIANGVIIVLIIILAIMRVKSRKK